MRCSRLPYILVLPMLLAACVDPGAPNDNDRLGRYALRSINGSALPGLVVENSIARLEFLKGALRINKDGTFTDSTDLRVTPRPDGAVRLLTDVASGTWRMAGDTVFFDSIRPGEHYFMTFQTAGSLTQLLGTATLVYRK